MAGEIPRKTYFDSEKQLVSKKKKSFGVTN